MKKVLHIWRQIWNAEQFNEVIEKNKYKDRIEQFFNFF